MHWTQEAVALAGVHNLVGLEDPAAVAGMVRFLPFRSHDQTTDTCTSGADYCSAEIGEGGKYVSSGRSSARGAAVSL